MTARLLVLLLPLLTMLSTASAVSEVVSFASAESLMPRSPDADLLKNTDSFECALDKIEELPRDLRRRIPKTMGVEKTLFVSTGRNPEIIGALLAPRFRFDCATEKTLGNSADTARILRFWKRKGRNWRPMGATPAWSLDTFGNVQISLSHLAPSQVRLYQTTYFGGSGFTEDSYFELTTRGLRRLKWYHQDVYYKDSQSFDDEKMGYLEQHPELCDYSFNEIMVDFEHGSAQLSSCEPSEKLRIERRLHVRRISSETEVTSPFR